MARLEGKMRELHLQGELSVLLLRVTYSAPTGSSPKPPPQNSPGWSPSPPPVFSWRSLTPGGKSSRHDDRDAVFSPHQQAAGCQGAQHACRVGLLEI